ncbi:tetratricopeptide repeat protein [Spirosoma sp. KCTC 42546]|uniref:tetratricopeptide repeat protein n=1 Tax=Spirosoma sp. KCTC 42546 TaxID=2520506 RepID=UPI00115A4BC5|nr:tetratricopeptide repeat protein [Spirosoma sp. KCTC 42546]QDK77257.1 tetratricopeptide repeat protein [Spirosoma sp. KCTC 42546]
MKKLVLTIWLMGIALIAQAQLYDPSAFDKVYDGLLKHPGVQIESAEAINQMYNYKFYEADKEFRWLRVRYPKHPMPTFLMGLAEWWKIVPNTDETGYDDQCLMYMDSTITLAEELYDKSENKLEPSFFLAAAYAFKSRLYSERKKWAKATFAGKNALKYFEKCKGNADFSPELLFGDGMYNYYAQWIPENYPLLKPILLFFPKGNKVSGIKELEKTANTAFYTRVEARYFLVQIYSMENQYDKAYQMSKYMNEQYPDNPFFERYFARSAFVTGRTNEAERVSKDILEKISRTQSGYEAVSGRTAAYILAYINAIFYKNIPEAKKYYQQAVDFSKQTNATTSGYYLSSVIGLAKIATEEKDYDLAQTYFKEVIDKAERKSSQYKEAKKALDDAKKSRREERRKRN